MVARKFMNMKEANTQLWLGREQQIERERERERENHFPSEFLLVSKLIEPLFARIHFQSRVIHYGFRRKVSLNVRLRVRLRISKVKGNLRNRDLYDSLMAFFARLYILTPSNREEGKADGKFEISTFQIMRKKTSKFEY